MNHTMGAGGLVARGTRQAADKMYGIALIGLGPRTYFFVPRRFCFR
jgi:hypothetical protein